MSGSDESLLRNDDCDGEFLVGSPAPPDAVRFDADTGNAGEAAASLGQVVCAGLEESLLSDDVEGDSLLSETGPGRAVPRHQRAVVGPAIAGMLHPCLHSTGGHAQGRAALAAPWPGHRSARIVRSVGACRQQRVCLVCGCRSPEQSGRSTCAATKVGSHRRLARPPQPQMGRLARQSQPRMQSMCRSFKTTGLETPRQPP